ncbi:MAG: SIMPL domain-containing protein [Microbacteriaceae bacterium]|nr:SIMPL domain-containing protein [Microbacteriaceae bacterium]
MIIRVIGTFERTEPAERGILRCTAAHEAGDPAQAMAVAQSLAGRVREAIESLDAGSVKRFTLNAARTSSWQEAGADGAPGATRHRVEVDITAVFTRLDLVGAFAAAWGAEPGLLVHGVEWALSDETRQRHADAVLTAAVHEATRRARVIAAASGAGEPRIVEVRDPEAGAPGAVAYSSEELRQRYGAGARYSWSAYPLESSVDVAPSPIVIAAAVEATFEA